MLQKFIQKNWKIADFTLLNKPLRPLIHILPNISKNKDNQTMKFGQLIECNMTNTFLEKSYTKRGGETSPRPFSGKWKLSISLNQQSTILYSLFLLQDKLRAVEIHWN